jgi:uncharacterized membrane protein YeaQ/YmgE (transglycosylase-associated protein family)
MFALLGMVIVGALGSWLGDFSGPLASVVLGAVGSGVGFYYGRRLHDEWFE